MEQIEIDVSIFDGTNANGKCRSLKVLRTDCVAAVIRLILQLPHDFDIKIWELSYLGKALPHESAIGLVIPGSQFVASRFWFALRLRSGASELADELVDAASIPPDHELLDTDFDDMFSADSDFAPEDESDGQVVALDEESADEAAETIAGDVADLEVEAEGDEEEVEEEVATGKVRMPAALPERSSTKRATKQYQATVRHYSRMNPERVYPLLVILTRDMVLRIQKERTTQQVSGPFQANVCEAIEVEPILPGCLCYPSKQSARLTGQDHTFTFHVVPQIVGPVTGAAVVVR